MTLSPPSRMKMEFKFLSSQTSVKLPEKTNPLSCGPFYLRKLMLTIMLIINLFIMETLLIFLKKYLEVPVKSLNILPI